MSYYEQRRVIVQRGALPEYRRLVHETLWPALADLNHALGQAEEAGEETVVVTGDTDLMQGVDDRTQKLLAASA